MSESQANVNGLWKSTLPMFSMLSLFWDCLKFDSRVIFLITTYALCV